MKAAFERLSQFSARAWRRTSGAVRRHPWRTLAALPALAIAYVLVLVPFTPSIGDIKKAKQEQPTVVLSADGKELAVFKRANRDWVKLSDVSPHVVTALLATEDHRFYDHPGLDVIRTLRAAARTLAGDRQGGSTLTQQLARNLYPEDIGRAPTITRKLKEAITALKIEAVFSKDEILESYLNSVSFLYNAWGIQMAARTYFDKPADKLNELEAATLVGMLKGTSYYNPVLAPERAQQRRNTVLAQMVKHGKLPEAKFAELKDQPLKLDFERLPEFSGSAPHMTEYLRRWLFEWADKHDYNIYSDGLVVKTTIDSRLQALANQAVTRQADMLQAVADVEWGRSGAASFGTDPKAYVAQRAKVQPFEHYWNSRKDLVNAFIRETAEYRELRGQKVEDAEAIAQLRDDANFMQALRKRKTQLQAGFMALDPLNGQIRAWVGSRDYNDDKFDHVQQARRQPGSTFKPFVYGAAFEQGMSPMQQLMDAQMDIQIDKNKVWRPSDVGEGPTNQPMTLREGLARSKNTITAQLMMQVGPSRVASLARAMGVRQSKLDEVPSLALGTSPVTLKEMVSSFGTIANGGTYMEPVLVTSIEDRHGSTVETFGIAPAETALSAHAAMTLLDVLRGVVEEGTAVGLKHRFGITGDVAGKTGTTQDNTDGWFILMHPKLVAGAWVGFNDNRVTMRSEYWGQGSHNALLVVGDFFQQSFKGNLLDAKATFAAPRQKDLEPAPLLDRMNDWFSSVFSTPAAVSEPIVVTTPPARFEPPVLQPPPTALATPSVSPMSLPAPSSAPAATEPGLPPELARVPSFPRPLEPVRPAESVSGTQVYMQGSARPAPAPAATPSAIETRPAAEVVLAPRPAQGPEVIRVMPSSNANAGGSSFGGASSMGAGGSSGAASSAAISAPATPMTTPMTSAAEAPAAATGSPTGLSQ
ncbi:penicillin-binding protein [Caenimonas sedimenti]|uniref:Penicillin-binding protein n=1 Tax=Caenimonas sedimenti TaxID=2596921 RepID=A0A562ZTD9_9BURK|nr:transglycosylase domain-containing protein [Caenimonas sedimenti]TWO71598.1 penicillin-binding protein [Caenimonas sedimenti]